MVGSVNSANNDAIQYITNASKQATSDGINSDTSILVNLKTLDTETLSRVADGIDPMRSAGSNTVKLLANSINELKASIADHKDAAKDTKLLITTDGSKISIRAVKEKTGTYNPSKLAHRPRLTGASDNKQYISLSNSGPKEFKLDHKSIGNITIPPQARVATPQAPISAQVIATAPVSTPITATVSLPNQNSVPASEPSIPFADVQIDAPPESTSVHASSETPKETSLSATSKDSTVDASDEKETPEAKSEVTQEDINKALDNDKKLTFFKTSLENLQNRLEENPGQQKLVKGIEKVTDKIKSITAEITQQVKDGTYETEEKPKTNRLAQPATVSAESLNPENYDVSWKNRTADNPFGVCSGAVCEWFYQNQYDPATEVAADLKPNDADLLQTVLDQDHGAESLNRILNPVSLDQDVTQVKVSTLGTDSIDQTSPAEVESTVDRLLTELQKQEGNFFDIQTKDTLQAGGFVPGHRMGAMYKEGVVHFFDPNKGITGSKDTNKVKGEILKSVAQWSDVTFRAGTLNLSPSEPKVSHSGQPNAPTAIATEIDNNSDNNGDFIEAQALF